MLKCRPKALFFNTKKGLHVYVYFPSCEKKKREGFIKQRENTKAIIF